MIVLFEDKKPAGKGKGAPAAERRPLFGRAAWRKARAIADIADGLLTEEEACARYGVDADELATWRRALQSFGIRPGRGRDAGTDR